MARVTLVARTKKGSRKKSSYSKKRKTTVLDLIPKYSRGSVGLRRAAKIYQNPFPKFRFVKHKYVDRVTLPAATVAGNPTWFIMRANSLFDPDFTGVGHQPMFRDEMAAKYSFYTVLSSQCKFVIPPEYNQPQTMGIILDDENSTPTDFLSVMEYNSHTNPTKLDKRNGPMVLRKSFNAAKEFKTTKKAIMADDFQRIAANLNPGSGVVRYFKLFSFPLNGGTTLPAQDLFVEMTFYAVWQSPDNDPTTS